MRHLALAVRDQERSRAFYERYLGFDAGESRRCDDGVLMLHDESGFALALGRVAEPFVMPPFLHFGKGLPGADAVRALRDRVVADGLEVVEWWDEPRYVSLKVRDPDGYVVELFWEPS